MTCEPSRRSSRARVRPARTRRGRPTILPDSARTSCLAFLARTAGEHRLGLRGDAADPSRHVSVPNRIEGHKVKVE
ncbi:hypothetical protein GUJ93_ZPchr0012g18972 [Zizania palustris]|uniref:Uncharacterized protein n=1 Tax=Zizania palustris TaxID=103762 RepID=A0A8J5WQI5_ZIZPA|nr:hypothetical protein GUJ93_ZPchr0012g18972 [Zizania palustris]